MAFKQVQRFKTNFIFMCIRNSNACHTFQYNTVITNATDKTETAATRIADKDSASGIFLSRSRKFFDGGPR